MKVKRTEFWTVFGSGVYTRLCSRHKTAPAAWRHAARCEAKGGAVHEIVEVNYLDHPEKKRRR